MKTVTIGEAIEAMAAGKKVYKISYSEVSPAIQIKYLFDQTLMVDDDDEPKQEVPELELTVKEEPKREITTFAEAPVDDEDEEMERVIDKIMPLISNKTYEITPEEERIQPEPVEEKKPKKPTINDEAIKQYYMAGLGAREIAKVTGMNYKTVWRHIDDMKNRGELI